MSDQQFQGVTAPMSLKSPTEADLAEDKRLVDALTSLEAFPTADDNRKRILALIALEDEAIDWIKDIATENGLPEQVMESAGGKIFVFGSFRLAVSTKTSDTDAVLVAPWFVEREAFFRSFYRRLRDHPETSGIRCVSEAFVPVLKLTFRGFDFDLLFAPMLLQAVPEDFHLVRCMDKLSPGQRQLLAPQTVRSLNGVRVTEALLELVPDPDVFKTSLKAVRLWAKRKQLCSNILGFPGGVAWAILTARVCQLFPNACAAMIVQKFFFVYNLWQWPRPIVLRSCSDPQLLESWQVMPVITPAEPPQNATYNVTESALKVMKKAFADAVDTIKAINFKKASWEQLFRPADFFASYKEFLQVGAEGNHQESYLEMSGLVESRMRHIVIALDHNRRIDVAHINTQSFEQSSERSAFAKHWFVGLEIKSSPESKGDVDLSREIQQFVVNTWRSYFDKMRTKPLEKDVNIYVKHVRRSQLPDSSSRKRRPEEESATDAKRQKSDLQS